MIGLLDLLYFALTYVAVAVGAFTLHLFSGVLSVGPTEVRRQASSAYDDLGAIGTAVMILTAGIEQLDKDDEIVVDKDSEDLADG